MEVFSTSDAGSFTGTDSAFRREEALRQVGSRYVTLVKAGLLVFCSNFAGSYTRPKTGALEDRGF